jgi:hypothetical protein
MDRLPAPKTLDEYRDGVISWLIEKWGEETHCPYCGNPTWEVGPVVASPKVPSWPSPAEDAGGFFPMVPIACSNCGHAVHIRALDIFEPQNPKGQ